MLAVAVIGCGALAGCGGGGSKSVATPDPGSAATATPNNGAESTAIASSVAAHIETALPQAADVPAALSQAARGVQIVAPNDFPGQSVQASLATAQFGGENTSEFLKAALIVPDTGGPTPLMDAFTPQTYLQGLTANPQGSADPVAVTGGPPGARSFRFTGDLSATGATEQLTGEVLAFVHGKVFVLLVHGNYTATAAGVDLVALASLIDTRLAALPDAN